MIMPIVMISMLARQREDHRPVRLAEQPREAFGMPDDLCRAHDDHREEQGEHRRPEPGLGLFPEYGMTKRREEGRGAGGDAEHRLAPMEGPHRRDARGGRRHFRFRPSRPRSNPRS
jgi:hypothetical protein